MSLCSSLFLAFQFPDYSQATLSITPCFPTPLSVFAQPKYLLGFSSNPFLPTVLHLRCCPNLPLPDSAPCLLPFPHSLFPVVHSTPSLPKLELGAPFPSLLSPFSPLPSIAAQISLSFLLLIHCPCSFCWSSFSTPPTLHGPSPAGPFFSPAHYLLVQLPPYSLRPASISSLTSSPQDKSPSPLLFSSRTLTWKMFSGHCKVV